jgi:glutamate-1-semialdehyde 2,1-aminomutase
MTHRSSEFFARAQKHIPGGVNSPVRAFRNVGGEPFFVAHAEGARMWDIDTNEYIDYVGSWERRSLGIRQKLLWTRCAMLPGAG